MPTERSVGGDLRAFLLAAELGLTDIYQEGSAPETATFPFATILHPVSDTRVLSGDARALARRRAGQLDLWQRESNENPALVEAVIALLDGRKSTGARRHRFLVTNVNRITEPDIVHHAISWQIAYLTR